MDRQLCARAASAAGFLFAFVLAAGTTHADAPFAFTKVIDQNAALPGSVTPPPPFFFEFSPAIDSGHIAFSTSRDFPYHGLFVSDGSSVSRVADRGTALPNGTGTLGLLNGFTQDGAASVFTSFATDGTFQGVFRAQNGVLTTVADSNTMFPSTDGGADARLGGAFVPSADGATVAFNAGTNRGQGVYTVANGSFHTIADRFTPVPGFAGAFFSAVGPAIVKNGTVAFDGIQFVTASSSIVTGQGIYRASAVGGGAVTTVVDTNTAKPGGGTFGDLVHTPGDQLYLVDFDGQNTVFYFNHSDTLYADVDGTIREIAGQDTLVPGTSAPLVPFGTAAIDNGMILFDASSKAEPRGIYAWDDGAITRILSVGDVVDGKHVQSYNFDKNSLDGNQFAVTLAFSDGATGVYRAVVPEPGAIGAIGMAAVALIGRRHRRTIA